MTVEEAILARILSIGAVTALVGTRVWLDKVPEHPVLPCVLVQLAGFDQEGQLLRGPNGLPEARVQVDCYARELTGEDAYGTAQDVSDAVHGDGLGRQASGVFGWIGSVGSPGFEIKGIREGNRRRQYDPEEMQVVTVSRDYLVRYRH